MKDPKERRRHVWTVVAIVGGGGVVLLLLVKADAGASVPPARAGSAAPSRSAGAQVSRHSLNFAPNPANPALEESMIQAKEAALGLYDQSAVAEKGAAEQYQLGVNQDTTAKAIAFNENATQLKETGITTAAEQTIAQEETAAQEQAAQEEASVQSQYASAQQTQAQGGFWGNLLGGFGGLLGMLGFNFAGTGAGTGYVDQYGDPVLPPQYDLPGGDPYAALGEQVPLPAAYMGSY